MNKSATESVADSSKTDKWGEKSKPSPRTVFRSKWWVGDKDTTVARSAIYVRPKREGEVKGKLNIKVAKRARVKAWKEEKEVSLWQV